MKKSIFVLKIFHFFRESRTMFTSFKNNKLQNVLFEKFGVLRFFKYEIEFKIKRPKMLKQFILLFYS